MRGVPLSIQYLYIGNTAQSRPRERPSHPSIFSAGRAKPLSTSPGSPNVFTTRSTTTTTHNTTTDRVIHSLEFPPRCLLTTATGARRVTMAPAAAAAASAAAGDAKPTSASTPPASTPTPTPTQRKVTRSRLGCETCRARKVRCDERPGKCEWKSFFLNSFCGFVFLICFSFWD